MNAHRIAVAATLVIVVAQLGTSVEAQSSCPTGAVGCHDEDVDFAHRDALFDDVMLDTGWQPAGAPVQVRFALFVGGSTEVDLGGTASVFWPNALSTIVAGRAGAGRLRMNYGIEVIARIRFDVDVAGVRYTWEGDIPIPGGIPRDLRMFDEITFDPFVLPGAPVRPVAAYDETEVVTLYELDITDSIIPIPGIGGGLAVDAYGSLQTAYRTEWIDLSGAVTPIVGEGELALIRTAPFGASEDIDILPHGLIDYDGTVTLVPTLFIEVAGSRFDLPLIDIPVDLVDVDANTDFNTETVHVPLPDVVIEPRSIDFGLVDVRTERTFTIRNEGEAELTVDLDARSPASAFDVDAMSWRVPTRSQVTVVVGYDPALGDSSELLRLSTNDPDAPEVTVALRGATPVADAGAPDSGRADAGADGGLEPPLDGGCGCRVPSHRPVSRAFWLAPLLGLTLLRRGVRRRRRSARSPR